MLILPNILILIKIFFQFNAWTIKFHGEILSNNKNKFLQLNEEFPNYENFLLKPIFLISKENIVKLKYIYILNRVISFDF